MNAENGITSVNGTVATYSYLGALRVRRQFGGTTVYVYSGTVPIAEYVGGSLTKEYIYAGSQLLATMDSTTGLRYQYPDHLSTRVEADSNAAITRTFGRFPFGEAWYETGTASKWKLTTYERGGESQLDYAMFRYDSSRLGRFMSPDLLGGDVSNPETLNRYTYVLNNPVSYSDPLGLFCVWDDGSYDSPDDPDTGSMSQCADAGGTWFDYSPSDLGLGADWSPDPNADLAALVGGMANQGLTLYAYGTAQAPGGGLTIPLDSTDLSNESPGFTLGVLQPGQTWTDCMQQNSQNYSIVGAIDLTRGTDWKDGPLNLAIGNDVSGLLFGSASEKIDAVGGHGIGEAAAAGAGRALTFGRRTAAIFDLNLAAKGGLPKALASTGAKQAIEKALMYKLAADVGATLAEALGCSIHR